ncbi:acyl-CoA dehydrogenase family protein [Gordonia sp. MP11Mi]|uniref:Acyl-CoA dehydrogenase/oxidase N-terminal domain-containing protein n=1 Tax=Gordonia sp. MP11Mi TaxID=3022769 RepID=A0AA97CS88_9ACTN
MTVTYSEHNSAAVDEADDHPFVARVRRYADTVLAPSALDTDLNGVSAERVAELADLGLLNHLAPVQFDGAALGRVADRRVHEILSGSCLNTWLVWAQHAPIVGRLAATGSAGNRRSELADEILSGRILLGAGLSDVRGYPDRYVTAHRVASGWRLAGTISWVSGWGLNSALTVAAVDPATERVVTAIVPVGESTRGAPLDLWALGGSRTARVRVDDVFVPDENVLDVEPLHAWDVADRAAAGDARAHHFGVAAAILGELAADRSARAADVARVWRPRVAELRRTAYMLADEADVVGDKSHRHDERLATKVATTEALGTLSRALVVARAGRALAADNTAQLHARNALFVLVQGQRADIRDAQLVHLAR